MDSNIWLAICASIIGTLGFCALTFSKISDWLYKKKLDRDGKQMIREAHEAAKVESDSKSIDDLMSDRAARFGGSPGSKTKAE